MIAEKDGRVRQIVNKVVTSLNKPAILPNAPDGNQEISIGWERSELYYGNIRNFSLPLGFVTDGASILRNDYYKTNIDRELDLLIKRLTYEFTETTYKEYYKQFYKGELDFSTAEDKQGEKRFEINIMEGGLQKLMKANESTSYEIPFDTDAKNIRMDGMFIAGKEKWFITEYTQPVGTGAYLGLQPLNSDTVSNGFAALSSFPNTDAPSLDNVNYWGEATNTITGAVLGGIITLDSQIGTQAHTLDLVIFNAKTGVTRTINLFTGNVTAGSPLPVVLNTSFDMTDGDRLFLRDSGPFLAGRKILESQIDITFASRASATTVPAFTLFDLGRKLVEKMTGSADNFSSSLLEDLVDGSTILVTSGDGVRGLPNASIKTSWRDYFKAVDVYMAAGMQITDKVRIESRESFFDSTQEPIDLGEVKKFRCSPAINYMGTSVKIGHAEQQVDDTNGKLDFNGFDIFISPIKRLAAKEIDLQTNWKAGPIEIEQTRANYEGKTTTDKSTDNSVFVIVGTPDPTNVFVKKAVFKADGSPFTPGKPLLSTPASAPVLRAGMILKITGSTLNDGTYKILDASPWLFGQLVNVDQPLTDEDNNLDITFEIVEGQYYTIDRSIPVEQLSVPEVDPRVKATIFNVAISPKRLLLKHARWIASWLYNYLPGALKFDSANRNADLIAGGIVERADLLISAMGSPLFLPFYFEFETLTPVDMPAVLAANPNPVFRFTWEGNDYTGFFMKGGFAANTMEEQTFKLLACPNQNILNLIQ